MDREYIRYIFDLVIGTLIGLPFIFVFLSILVGLVYYLIYPLRVNKARELAIYGISVSLSVLITLFIILFPFLIISYLLTFL